MKAILTGYLVLYLLASGAALNVVAGLYGLSWLVTSAHAESFYPACLKRDGDWLQGVTRKECIGKDVRGQWVTGKVLKRARRVM